MKAAINVANPDLKMGSLLSRNYHHIGFNHNLQDDQNNLDSAIDSEVFDRIKALMNDRYHNKAWMFCDEEESYYVPIIEYHLALSMLGTAKLLALYRRCPRTIFAPIVTLVCHLPAHLMYGYLHVFLFRNDDEAVALKLIPGGITLYLVPSTSTIMHKDNFHDVTKQ